MIGGSAAPIDRWILKHALNQQQFGDIVDGSVLGFVSGGQALIIIALRAADMVGIRVGVYPIENRADDGRDFTGINADNAAAGSRKAANSPGNQTSKQAPSPGWLQTATRPL